jgi:hypothetical protein
MLVGSQDPNKEYGYFSVVFYFIFMIKCICSINCELNLKKR